MNVVINRTVINRTDKKDRVKNKCAIKTKNRATCCFSVILFLIMNIIASPTFASSDAKHPAEIVIKQTTDSIFSEIIKNRDAIKKDINLLHKMVNEIVIPHFDFKKMAGWVLGKHWRKTNSMQKDEFTKQFRILLVRTYANALANNADQKIIYKAVKVKNKKKVTVQTEIEQKGTFSLPINYRMHLKDKEWKVYDVNIDGISLVTNYRSSFASEIRKGSITKLIKKLTERNQKAGATSS